MHLSPSLMILVGAALAGACSSPVLAAAPDAADAPDLAAPADLAGADVDGALPADAAWGPAVACGAPLPGEPLSADLIEAQPGYAEALAAVDSTLVPDPFDYGGDSKLAVAVINYMLGRSSGTRATRAELLANGLGRAVLGAAARGQGGKVDFAFLRRGLHHFYPCARPVPATLSELRRRYGDFEAWPSQEIACSRPKDGPRRLYERPAGGVYIAQSVVAGAVRETEVLFTDLRPDGQLDFAVYTAAGELSDRSTFAAGGGNSVTSAAPYTCISCHLDTTAWRISDRFPAGRGAGCR